MTVSDDYGRVLAEDGHVAVAEPPTSGATTICSRLGDRFAWLCPAAAACCVADTVRRRTPTRSDTPQSREPLDVETNVH